MAEQSLPLHPDGDEQFLYRWDRDAGAWMRVYFNSDKLDLNRRRTSSGSDSLSETCFTCNMPLKNARITARLECLDTCSEPHEITVQVCNEREAKQAIERLKFMHTLVRSGRVSEDRPAKKRPKPRRARPTTKP